jgi:hypothetical protein
LKKKFNSIIIIYSNIWWLSIMSSYYSTAKYYFTEKLLDIIFLSLVKYNHNHKYSVKSSGV